MHAERFSETEERILKARSLVSGLAVLLTVMIPAANVVSIDFVQPDEVKEQNSDK